MLHFLRFPTRVKEANVGSSLHELGNATVGARVGVDAMDHVASFADHGWDGGARETVEGGRVSKGEGGGRREGDERDDAVEPT